MAGGGTLGQLCGEEGEAGCGDAPRPGLARVWLRGTQPHCGLAPHWLGVTAGPGGPGRAGRNPWAGPPRGGGSWRRKTPWARPEFQLHPRGGAFGGTAGWRPGARGRVSIFLLGPGLGCISVPRQLSLDGGRGAGPWESSWF